MTFPRLVPTSRSFEPGNFPIKTYRSESGQETRILYGSTRTDLKMSLTYANITDADAELFLDHYDEVKGTFKRFKIRNRTTGGFEGDRRKLENKDEGVRYRYEGPPQLTQVREGISTVTVNLIGVL